MKLVLINLSKRVVADGLSGTSLKVFSRTVPDSLHIVRGQSRVISIRVLVDAADHLSDASPLIIVDMLRTIHYISLSLKIL